MLNLLQNSPFRSVNWRWQKAIALRTSGRPVSRRQDDMWIRQAFNFQTEVSTCRDEWHYLEIAEKYPAIADAKWIFDKDGAKGSKYELEARLLVKEETSETIANRLCVSVDSISAYESLFFNVRDRLHHKGWITHNVLGRSVQAGFNERDFDLLWKLFGYWMGSFTLDFMIDTFIAPQRPTSADRVVAALSDDARMTLARKAVIAIRTMPVNSFTQQGILELEQRFREMEKDAAGSGGASGQMVLHVIGEVVGQMGWCVGEGTPERPTRLIMRPVDSYAAEPRATEMLAIAAGIDPGMGDDVVGLKFPEATKHGSDR